MKKGSNQSKTSPVASSYSTKPTCSSAVIALCAMGMITSDNRISTAALKEMPKLTDSNYTMDIHALTCLSMFLTVGHLLVSRSVIHSLGFVEQNS